MVNHRGAGLPLAAAVGSVASQLPTHDASVRASDTDPRIKLDKLNRRERALTKLLSSDGDGQFANAVNAIVIARQPLMAGLAMFQRDTPDLRIEAAWFDGQAISGEDWTIGPAHLREMVGAGDAGWSATLQRHELPLSSHCGDLAEASFHCNTLACQHEIAGFLFYVLPTGAAAHGDDFGNLEHLIARKLSADIDLAAERRANALAEQQFHDAVATSFDWFWEFNADFQVTHLSDRWADLGGISAAEAYGRTLDELGVDTNGTRWGRFLSDLATVGEVSGFGARTSLEDGSYVYWKLNGRAYFGETGELRGYRGSGTDVTAEVIERRRAEKAERLLREAIEALPQGFVLFDEYDRLVVCNEQFKDLHPEIAGHLESGAEFADLVQEWAQNTPDRPNDVSVEDLVNRRMKAHRADCREFEIRRSLDRAYLINERKTSSGSAVWLHTDVTSLKKREGELQRMSDALKVTNQHLDVTVNAISDGLITFAADRTLAFCNKRFREMLNLPEELAVAGTPSEAIMEFLETQGRIVGVAEDFSANWEIVREQGDLTYRRQLPDGSELEVNGVRTQDGGMLLAIRDVTLAERQSAALREQAEQFEALSQALAKQNAYFDGALNSMIQALATFDPDDRLIVCNLQFQEIFNLPEHLIQKDTHARDIAAYLHEAGLMENGPDRVTHSHQMARKNGTDRNKMSLLDGRVFEVLNSLLENGDLLVTFHEITAMEEHAQRLNDYAERLEFSNRELQEFAYVASHDLQEPLRKIEAFSGRLQQKYADSLDDTGQAYVERMQKSSRRMRSLINDLLDYSRISTKATPFKPVDLGSIIDGVVSDLEIALEASGGTVRHTGLPVVEADPAQISRLFQNLISNAIKFGKQDEAPLIDIHVETDNADDASVRADGMCRIVVSDNGIGFDNKYGEQIFKIFHRLNGRSEYEGTGIGLAACRKIVERHGGWIRAQSELGSGTKMTVCIPFKQFHDEGQIEDEC